MEKGSSCFVCQQWDVRKSSLDVGKRLVRFVRPGQESTSVLRFAQDLVERSDEHRIVRNKPMVNVYQFKELTKHS